MASRKRDLGLQTNKKRLTFSPPAVSAMIHTHNGRLIEKVRRPTNAPELLRSDQQYPMPIGQIGL